MDIHAFFFYENPDELSFTAANWSEFLQHVETYDRQFRISLGNYDVSMRQFVRYLSSKTSRSEFCGLTESWNN